MADPYNSSEASHRALRAIQQELERHPIVTAVQGFPDGEFTELRAALAVERWEIERENATASADRPGCGHAPNSLFARPIWACEHICRLAN